MLKTIIIRKKNQTRAKMCDQEQLVAQMRSAKAFKQFK